MDAVALDFEDAMMCRKRPYSIMNSSYGCIRSPILCAPAFNAVPWLGEAACIPVVQYTAPESTVTLKKRHPVEQAVTPDPVKPGSGNFHKINVLPDNVPMSPVAKMAQSSTPPADVHTDHLSPNMAQLHSWGRREHGMLGRGAALFLTFFGGMCNIPTHQQRCDWHAEHWLYLQETQEAPRWCDIRYGTIADTTCTKVPCLCNNAHAQPDVMGTHLCRMTGWRYPMKCWHSGRKPPSSLALLLGLLFSTPCAPVSRRERARSS